MASLTLSQISKVYPGGVTAVKSLDLQVADGELVVLLGPSGCGKSTILRMVAGLEQPSAGDVLLDGRRVNHLPPAARHVAMVFQDYALYPHLSIRDNLAFGPKLQGLAKPEIARRIQSCADLLALGDVLDRRPHQISGGQQQRVALGRAMATEPALFLFDEPLSNLDAQLRAQLRTEIAALHRRLGRTTLYVTHDQAEAMTLADRVVVLRDGIVQQVGTAHQVYQQPANRFVASFVGSPPMNLFPGEVSQGQFHGAEGIRWAVPDAPSGHVVLGVRPEDLVPTTADAPIFMVAEPHLVENLGHEAVVHFRHDGCTYSFRNAPAAAPIVGCEVPLTLRPGSPRLFAADAEGRLID